MSKEIARRLEAAQAVLFRENVHEDIADNGEQCGFKCLLCEEGDDSARENIAHLPECPLYDYRPPVERERVFHTCEELVPNAAWLFNADCQDVLRQMAFEGTMFDSAAFDPPYHYESIVKRFGKKTAARSKDESFDRVSKNFVGKDWDGGDLIFRPDIWRLIHTVMKPGAYVAAFSADKFYHRMATAMEAAGFIPVRMIAWLYGNERVKFKDIAKMIAKKHGEEKAKAFIGWASDLKVALQPIALFRKKLDGTLSHNAMKHDVGGLNIAAAAVPVENHATLQIDFFDKVADVVTRFPSNVVHDGSAEVEFDFSFFGEAGASTPPKGGGRFYGDHGSPARFFYSAGPSKAEKGDTKHPTVKKVELMEWLVRMITPRRGGLVLDPFAGTGTTGVACLRQGFKCYMVERDAGYAADLRGRIVKVSGADTPLFASARP